MTAPPTQTPKPAFRLASYAAITLLFLFLRAFHIGEVMNSPAGQIPIIDSKYYLEWAIRISEGLGLGPHPFFMSPLYSLLIAFSTGLDREIITSAFWLQSLLSLGSMLLIGRFAARHITPWAGPIAALVYALYAPALFYDAVLLSASTILFLTMVFLTLLEGQLEILPWWRAGAAGLAVGLSALCRPNALLLLPAFGLLMLLRGKRSAWSRIGLLALGAALVLLPVMVRNARMGGGFTLTTNSLGVNLYIGNHEQAAGIYTEAPFLSSAEPIYEAEDYRRVASQRLGRDLTVTQSSTYWTGQALGWMVRHPVNYLKLQAKKLAYFLNRIEVANNVSLYGVTEYSAVLRFLRGIHFGWLAPLGLLGMLLRLRSPATGTAFAVLGAYLLANLLFFVSSEYRYPIISVLIPFAVAAPIEIWRRFRSGDGAAGVQNITILLLLTLFVNVPWKVLKREANPAMSYFNWASVSYGKDDLTNAALLFSAALVQRPDWAEAHLQLALVFEDMGMPDMADREFDAAGMSREQVQDFRRQESLRKLHLPAELRRDTEEMEPQELTSLGERFNQLGRSFDALRVLHKAYQMDSTNVTTLFQYGLACERTRNYWVAVQLYQKTEQIVPDDPQIPYRLAWSYFGHGDRGMALSTLRRTKLKAERLADKRSREYWLELVEQTYDRFQNF